MIWTSWPADWLASWLAGRRSLVQPGFCSGEVFGIIDNLKENKWKNTVVSENKSEVLVIPKETLIKKIFTSKEFTALTLDLLKMAN